MATILISFGLILAAVGMMSLGVIFGRKPISKENCGGCEGLKDDCAAGCTKFEKTSGPSRD